MDVSLFRYFDLGYTIWQCIDKRSKKWGRRYCAAMAALLAFSFAVLAYVSFTGNLLILVKTPLAWVQGLLPTGNSGIELAFTRLAALGIVGLGYVVFLSFPASVFFIMLRREIVDSRPKLKSPPKGVFLQHRARAPSDAYFAGIDAVTGEPIFIDDDARMEHTQIVGVTGGGKTEGGIVPALVHDIAWGRGAIIIDMKGDRWDITAQVVQNTNTKLILRQNDADSAEYAARLAGTRTTKFVTDQLEDGLIGQRRTGLSSVRSQEEFVIHPNIIRSLGTGRAALIRHGLADIVELNRAIAPETFYDPDQRGGVQKKAVTMQPLDLYGRWRALEDAKKGEGIRRPVKREPAKEAKGIDAIRAKMKDKTF